MRPLATEHPEYYGRYISLVSQNDVISALEETKRTFLAFIHSIDTSLENYAYADGKWTIKEVILHCSDTERIFSTRALNYARGDGQKSLAFDENAYAVQCHADGRSLKDIAYEYEAVANATAALFRSFSQDSLRLTGQTPSGPSTVNSIGFCICGHSLHHLNVIKERYLKTGAQSMPENKNL